MSHVSWHHWEERSSWRKTILVYQDPREDNSRTLKIAKEERNKSMLWELDWRTGTLKCYQCDSPLCSHMAYTKSVGQNGKQAPSGNWGSQLFQPTTYNILSTINTASANFTTRHYRCMCVFVCGWAGRTWVTVKDERPPPIKGLCVGKIRRKWGKEEKRNTCRLYICPKETNWFQVKPCMRHIEDESQLVWLP